MRGQALTERDRHIRELARRLPLRRVAEAAGVTYSTVTASLARSRAKARGEWKQEAPQWHGKKPTMDAGWLERNVALYLKSERPQHYLNGIAIVWGQAWADRVEAEATPHPRRGQRGADHIGARR